MWAFKMGMEENAVPLPTKSAHSFSCLAYVSKLYFRRKDRGHKRLISFFKLNIDQLVNQSLFEMPHLHHLTLKPSTAKANYVRIVC